MFGTNKLKQEIAELKGLLAVKDKEIEFYKMRGDRYFVSLDKRADESNALLQFAKEILKTSIENAQKRK